MDYNQLDIKKKRVISYFIDAATKIAEEKNFDSITIRNVANGAGYTSGTLYNYFEDLDQLLELTAINCITDYLKELSDILESNKNEVLKMIDAWQCYCKHSFSMPSIYTYVFSSSFSENVLAKIKVFAKIFPERLNIDNLSDQTTSLLGITITEKRNYEIISPCVKNGYFTNYEAHEIINIANILHSGFIYRLQHDEEINSENIEEAVQKFTEYFIVFIDNKRKSGNLSVSEIIDSTQKQFE